MDWFWRRFFLLVIVVAAGAMWACVAWFARALFGFEPTWPWHVAAIAVLLTLNLQLRSRPASISPASRTMRRAYSSVAFTSLFGAAFLLAHGLFWGAFRTLARAGEALSDSVVFGALTASAVDIAGLTGTAGLLGITASFAWGYSLGQRRVEVVDLEVELPGAGTALEGLTVVQISDIHLGQYLEPERVAGFMEQVNELEPDLVCITGDITDGLDHAPVTFPLLGRLRARLGVFAVLGNHDVATGSEAVCEAIEKYTDIRMLRDEVTPIPCGDRHSDAERTPDSGATLYLLGIDDLGRNWARGVEHHPALETLAASLPAGAPTLLMSHRPDLFGQAASLGIGLTLAGHTHGGQLAFKVPGRRHLSMAHFITRYPRGTYRHNGSVMHVNLGLGVTAQPVRLATPREITRITLRSTASGN